MSLGDFILVDRHHADLLYSLQRLFEDRLGVDLFVPVGHEWWDRGVWQFGACFGDDRLAQQYLVPHDGVWTDRGNGLYGTLDAGHPGRPIYGLTYEGLQSRRDRCRFIMSTVQENAPGFKRLADEVGATYLMHVGNTGQYCDWDLEPVVINTSELELPAGIRGVTVHQEMDRRAYRWRDPSEADRKTVRSFVNIFYEIPGYQQFLEAEKILGLEGWTFTSNGHGCRDGGFINPCTAVGDLMASAGWGWHDKPVGDGFGHVIHGWASVGRPLIGHASYYRNKLAEPLWRDGLTCIDLGRHSTADAIEHARAIAGDADTHFEMCHRIRTTFSRLVDYDAEAGAVRELLGL